MTLGILLPTRGRPENLARFIEAVKDTAEDWHLYARLDTDDPMLPEYEQQLSHWDRRISVARGPRIRFGPSLNEMAAWAHSDALSHIGMFGDDVVPVTSGWDTALVGALGGDLGVTYGDDGLRDRHTPDLPTHYVTQTEVYRRLGYLSPPGIQHLFLDNVARDVGRYLKNFVYTPVKVQHMHPWAVGEHLHDTTYAEGGRNAEIRKADRKAYVQWAGRFEWKRSLRG